MRANEFIIRIKRTNVVDVVPDQEDPSSKVVMVPPLQQDLELKKAVAGKKSQIIDQLIDHEEDEDEPDPYEIEI